jgi:uncharacterized membrane protein
MEILIIIHVLSVVLWIGGVGFVTMVTFPALQAMEDSMEKVRFFMGVERRFSRLARAYVIIVGITGVLLFFHRGGFGGIISPWIAIVLGFKVLIWLLFAILLFGAEKHLMKILVSSRTAQDSAFRRMVIFHWVMLIMSILAIACGISLTLRI